MKPSFWITLTISAVACCLVLFMQGRHNDRLADRVSSQRTVSGKKAPVVGESESPSMSDAVSPDGTVEESRVAGALSGVEQITSELGLGGASLGEQIAAMAAAMESGTLMGKEEKFERRVPELLELVENLNLDELFALVERTPDSQAKMFLEWLAAEQDPSRTLRAGVTDIYGVDALARIDPAAALQRLKGSLVDEEGVRKGDRARLSRYAVMMMQDDVEAGLRELMWIRDIEDTDAMATTRFDRPPLQGVDIAQLADAVDDPEFAELRNDIISMTLGHQLIGEGVTAVAQQAQSMQLTQEELTNHMDSLIKNDIMASEPEDTLAWITAAQPPETQLSMVPRAFLEWAKTDAIGARDWLDEQQESPLRDATIANFARRAPNLERQSAAQWALQIKDEGTRNSTLRNVVNKWRQENAAAADVWLRDNS